LLLLFGGRRVLALKALGNFRPARAKPLPKYTFEQFSGTKSPLASSFSVSRATGRIYV
jgi:hypothetical protein